MRFLHPCESAGTSAYSTDSSAREPRPGSGLGAPGAAGSERDEWYADPARFRVLVRRALLAKAVDEIAAGETPSDVAVGLAWLLAQDPVRPLPRAYGDGPERALNDQKLTVLHQRAGAMAPVPAMGHGPGLRGTLTGGQSGPHPARSNRRLGRGTTVDPAHWPGSQRLLRCRYQRVAGPRRRTDLGLHAEGTRLSAPIHEGDAMVGPAFSLALRRLHGQGVIDLRREEPTLATESTACCTGRDGPSIA